MCAGVQRAARRDHVESSFLPGEQHAYMRVHTARACTHVHAHVHAHVHVRCTQHAAYPWIYVNYHPQLALGRGLDLVRVRHSWRRPAAAAAASYANFSQAEAHVRVLLGSA